MTDVKKNVFYYGVFDEVACEFFPMYPAKNDKDAIRQFMDDLKKGNYLHYTDFKLYFMCAFSYENEDVKEHIFKPKYIGRAISVKDKIEFNQENKGVDEK